MANQSTKRSGISAAEKYAELEAAGLKRPRCECHGEPMRWNRTKSRWVCAIPRHSSISAKTKYETLRNLEERPTCDCHGLPMDWRPSPGMKCGGRWSCAQLRRERQHAYRTRHSESYREYRNEWYAKNSSNPAFMDRRRRTARDRYRTLSQDPEFMSQRRRRNREYLLKLSPEQKERIREADRLSKAKQRENPEFRRRRTIYMMLYNARRKREAYGNAGYTLGDNGQEGSGRRDRTTT